jgi:hypothetical protein
MTEVYTDEAYNAHLAKSQAAFKSLIARRQKVVWADNPHHELSGHLGDLISDAVASDDRVAHYRSEFESAMEIAATMAIVEALPITPEEFMGLLNGTHEVRPKAS